MLKNEKEIVREKERERERRIESPSAFVHALCEKDSRYKQLSHYRIYVSTNVYRGRRADRYRYIDS